VRAATDDEASARAEDVAAALDVRVRRLLEAHAGDVEVVEVSDAGDVKLAFRGACTACPARAVTFQAAVAPVVMGVSGVRTVRIAGLNVSSHALRRIAALAGVPTCSGVEQ